MFDAVIQKDGRITIPRFLRKRLGIKGGEEFAFHMVIKHQEDKKLEAEDDVEPSSVSSSDLVEGERLNDAPTS